MRCDVEISRFQQEQNTHQTASQAAPQRKTKRQDPAFFAHRTPEKRLVLPHNLCYITFRHMMPARALNRGPAHLGKMRALCTLDWCTVSVLSGPFESFVPRFCGQQNDLATTWTTVARFPSFPGPFRKTFVHQHNDRQFLTAIRRQVKGGGTP
jgi:hypothetical protein